MLSETSLQQCRLSWLQARRCQRRCRCGWQCLLRQARVCSCLCQTQQQDLPHTGTQASCDRGAVPATCASQHARSIPSASVHSHAARVRQAGQNAPAMCAAGVHPNILQALRDSCKTQFSGP